MIALYSFGKRFYAIFFCVSVPYFLVWILWPELRIYLLGIWFSNKDNFKNFNFDFNFNFNFKNFSGEILQILILCKWKLYVPVKTVSSE